MIARLLLMGSLMLSASALQAENYAWDFRNGHFDNLSLVPMGAGAVKLLLPAKDGLRISVPAGYNVRTVGFSPRFKIHGDFELVIEYTIVNRTPPESGFGSGPSLYLSTGSTAAAAASLGRLLRPDGRDVYGVFAARVEDGKRIPTARLFDVPDAASSRYGRLQLKRLGNQIDYSVADGLDSPLRSLASLAVSDDDVSLVRIGLSQSDQQSAASMVLHSVRIEADELPHLPSEQSRTAQLYRPRYQPSPPPRSYRWLWQSLLALGFTGVLVAWIWKRRQSS